MFTQCPECDAIFQLTASQLKAANGDVRCGQCLSVFNALNNLSEDVPHPAETDNAEDLAHDANQYRDWSGEATNDAASTAEAVETKPTEADSVTDNDVFSEVIAKVHAHDIPDEEIDRFEEFLAADELPTGGSSTTADDDVTTISVESSDSAEYSHFVEDSHSAEGSHPADDSHKTEESFSADDSLSAETPLSVEEPIPTEQTVVEILPNEDFSPATNETTNTTDETTFGDIDSVTADLDAEISIDDDEFAELDAYLNSTEDEYPDNVGGPIDKIDVNAGTGDDVIIIEAADLEPLTSPDYTDIPDTTPEQPAEGSPAIENDELDSVISATGTDTPDTLPELPAELPAEQPVEPAVEQAVEASPAEKTADESQTINIPTLILDDLHAAKAEQLRPSNAPWIAGSLVLMLVLVLQVVYHSRDSLAKDATLRPWIIQMCNIANCTLSQPFDIKQIEIIGRDVRSHPTARKALVVSTTLINNADFIQPFPLLTMVFSDINGAKIAQRRFTPREYLHNDIDLAAGMTPNMPVRIELELVDPGKAAVNYEFRAEIDPRRTRPLS